MAASLKVLHVLLEREGIYEDVVGVHSVALDDNARTVWEVICFVWLAMVMIDG